MSRILIGSPIRQKRAILEKFLSGIDRLDTADNEVDCFFVDDNKDGASSELLADYAAAHSNTTVKSGNDLISEAIDNDYLCDGSTHHWNIENINRITVIKDSIIEYALRCGYDHLFFIDSDIVTDKRALLNLLSDNVDIVSNVFYTQWKVNGQLVPQCFWIPDVYNQMKTMDTPLDPAEANRIRNDTLEELKIPGLHKVNGLGACTLISRGALEKGVRFKAIPNLSVPGEDRHFCIRAGCLGIDLYMDTVYPAYHIYREEYLSRVDEFMTTGFSFDMCMTFTEDATANVDNNKKNSLSRRALRRLKNRIERYLEK